MPTRFLILSTALAAAPALAQAPNGAALFSQNCAACHQAHGEGIPGAFPALAGDKFVTGDAAKVALTLLNGRGGMPSFKDGLSDDQLAAVSSYIRSNWGNKAPAIPAATYAKLRAGGAAAAGRPMPGH